MELKTLVWLIPVFPLIAFAVILLFTTRKRALSHSIAIGSVALSWLASMIVVVSAVLTPDFKSNPIHFEIPWFTTGDTPFVIGAQVDALGALGLFFVSWTVLMIFIYSTGYHNVGQPVG